jgi:hypothetical protein
LFATKTDTHKASKIKSINSQLIIEYQAVAKIVEVETSQAKEPVENNKAHTQTNDQNPNHLGFKNKVLVFLS